MRLSGWGLGDGLNEGFVHSRAAQFGGQTIPDQRSPGATHLIPEALIAKQTDNMLGELTRVIRDEAVDAGLSRYPSHREPSAHDRDPVCHGFHDLHPHPSPYSDGRHEHTRAVQVRRHGRNLADEFHVRPGQVG